MSENQTMIEGVEAAIAGTDPDTGHDYDVKDLETAQRAVDRLLGPGRKVETQAFPGSFLVSLTDDEWRQLQANGYLGYEDDEFTIEIEWDI